MFNATISLKDAAAAAVVYTRAMADLVKAVYTRAGSTLSLPVTMTVSHQLAKVPTGTDRHLLKHSRSAVTTEGKITTAIFNVTGSIPREGITRAMINDDIAAIREFFNDTARVDAWLNGEC